MPKSPFNDPDLWDAIADHLVKTHQNGHSIFDLTDRSHATDIAQIVCEFIAANPPT